MLTFKLYYWQFMESKSLGPYGWGRVAGPWTFCFNFFQTTGRRFAPTAWLVCETSLRFSGGVFQK